MPDFPPIQLLRPGTFTSEGGQKVTFSATDLSGIADSYDPDTHAAPIVVGHPRTDDPAYGWVRDLRVKDGRLVAEADQVAVAFADAVRAGRYKKVSASLFRPDHPANPTPGKYYLKHIGFLGAAAPAVSGLRPVQLSADDDGAITLDFAISKRKEPAVAKPSPDEAAAAADDDLRKREERLKAQELAFAAREKAARRKADSAAMDAVVAAGKPLPLPKERLLVLADVLADGEPVSFAAGEDAKSPHEVFMELLQALPKTVDFAERSKPGAGDAPDQSEADKLAAEIVSLSTGKRRGA